MKIREITNAEIDEVVSLHNTAYGDKRTTAMWNWEYRSYTPDLSVFAVVVDKKVIVGTNGRLPVYLNIKGKRNLTGKSENSLLRPDYRGGTLFQDLYRVADTLSKAKKMQCTWGFTTAVKVWREKLQFAVYDDCMYESFLILRVQKFISGVINPMKVTKQRKTALSIFAIGSSLYSLACIALFSFRKTSGKTYVVEHRLRSIDDLNALYERLKVKYGSLIHIDQDEPYISWRVFGNPNINYETYFVYEGSLLKGYCYVSKRDSSTVSLTDFTFEDTKAGSFILQSLIEKWQRDKIGHVFFLGNSENYLMKNMFRLLKRFGFILRRSPNYNFVLNNFSYEDHDYLYDIRNWYINGLWAEGDRL